MSKIAGWSPTLERVFATVPSRNTMECWEWTHAKTTTGYGQVRISNRCHHVHRLAYERFVGPIAPGMEIDHLCRNRPCFNPAHLEQVTHRTNGLRGVGQAAQNARKTHCTNGHPLSGDNLMWKKYGEGKYGRQCRTCILANKRRQYHASKSR